MNQNQRIFKVPIYLAAGTAAQQLDASFSTNSNLEVYALNMKTPWTKIYPKSPNPKLCDLKAKLHVIVLVQTTRGFANPCYYERLVSCTQFQQNSLIREAII